MGVTDAIPSPGLGTYRVTDYEQCVSNVTTALEIGYRHIDTAEAYQNEAAVGEAIEDSSVPSSEVYLATKVLHPKFTDDYSEEAIEANARGCLERLGIDEVDLFYGVHWPGGDYDPGATFAACATLYDEGLFDRLGICNVTVEQIEEAQEHSDVPISVLQAEMHPLLPQEELRAYCADHDIAFVAYAPLGNGRIFEVPEIQEIADKHGVSEAQVSLAWAFEQDAVPIPKATGRKHIEDNWRSRTLELPAEDLEAIDAIDREERQYSPDYAPDW